MLHVASPDKQSSENALWFGIQSKQSSNQQFYKEWEPPFHIRQQKTERHKLKSASGYVSKNGCEWDSHSNPCPHQTETYSGIEVAAILKRRTAATAMPKHEISLVGAGMSSNPIHSHFADIPRSWFKLMTFRLSFSKTRIYHKYDCWWWQERRCRQQEYIISMIVDDDKKGDAGMKI